ncbi:FlaD/FlaE family flagellar protein [Methanothermococcus sp.]|uniref:FlaD/FlaE family flagellar protein n=1 Tax=Methanothermococcus sp. TaxID=2614238 RepID=UPI0025DAFAA4|nr:FlaD/FlaE family flagellar protein [Methanothermococcus sp.]
MVSETELYSSSMEDYLTEDELEEYLENLKTKIPSFIVELLKNNLKNRKLTKNQLDRIVHRVTDLYLGKKPEDKKAEELATKINELSNKLDALMKVAAISSATKVSENIKNELINLEENVGTEQEKSEEVVEINEKADVMKEEKKESKIITEELDVEEYKPEELKTPEIEKKEEEHIVEEIKTENSKNVPIIGEEVIDMPTDLTGVHDKKYNLEELPEDTLSTMLVFKWLEFLISRVGLSNLIDILDYYYNLGWISENVVNRLIKISKNMKYLNEEFRKPMDKMISEDHIVSLLYIEKLAGRPIPVDELESMDREINRIRKWAEELQSV